MRAKTLEAEFCDANDSQQHPSGEHHPPWHLMANSCSEFNQLYSPNMRKEQEGLGLAEARAWKSIQVSHMSDKDPGTGAGATCCYQQLQQGAGHLKLGTLGVPFSSITAAPGD